MWTRELMRELALGRTEGGGKKLVELLNLPSLNMRGMSSARTGAGASNVIPSTATATIDIRLVKGITPAMAARASSITSAGRATHRRGRARCADTDGAPQGREGSGRSGGYNASRTSMDLPISQLVLRAAEALAGRS